MTKTQPFLIVLLLSVRLRLFTSLVFVGWKYYPWDGNDTGLFANPSRGCQLRTGRKGQPAALRLCPLRTASRVCIEREFGKERPELV